MKTEKLFKYYNSILSENVEGGAPDATDVAEVPAEAMAVDPAAITTEGEKIHADLLVKAFLHPPGEDDKAIVKELQHDVQSEPKEVIAKIADLLSMSEGEMKDTLDLA